MEKDMEKRVEVLRKRKKRCCCKFCGGELSLKRIVFSNFEDAKVELYCGHCDRVEFGIEPEIYRSAESFVDQLQYNCYPDMDDNAVRRQMNVAKVCEIMAWGYKHLGIIDQHGFTIPLDLNLHHWDECLVLRDSDLDSKESGAHSDGTNY